MNFCSFRKKFAGSLLYLRCKTSVEKSRQSNKGVSCNFFMSKRFYNDFKLRAHFTKKKIEYIQSQQSNRLM